jgi:hypothetical protein
MSPIWEDVNDIVPLYDPFFSLDEHYICGVPIGSYVVEFASNACNIFERGSKSPLCVSTLFKMQASNHDMLCLPIFFG